MPFLRPPTRIANFRYPSISRAAAWSSVLEYHMEHEDTDADSERVVIRMGDQEPIVLDRSQAIWLANTISQKVKA